MAENLELDRILDLSIAEDRRMLHNAARNNAELEALLDQHLEHYVNAFPDPDWHKVYSGGVINLRAGNKRTQGFDILSMMKLTRALKGLEEYKGFDKLSSGFKNPTQIASTYFEVLVADWCASREVSTYLEFSPVVLVKGHAKRPEFLWSTKFGEVYCECKRSNITQSSLEPRVNRLLTVLIDIYHKYDPWDPSIRIDVRFEGKTINGIERKFETLMQQISKHAADDSLIGKSFVIRDVSAHIRRRGEEVELEPDSIRVSSANATTVAQPLTSLTYLSLTMSFSGFKQDIAIRLLREARDQIPVEAVGAVFIDIGRSETVQRKILSLIVGQAYGNIPWVSLWSNTEPVWAAWRNEQPFDHRLLTGKA